MSRIPRETIDEVRDRTDLVALVERHVTLVRRGTRYVGLCPFHQEKTPSFGVIPEKGIFHCFGCQTGGDAFKFLMLIEGLSFIEAVKELATAAGITLETRELTADEQRALKRRATSYDVLTAATEFYRAALWTRPEGAVAREYVANRGLTRETADQALLGYAPEAWSALSDALHRQGFREELIRDVGLAKASKSGGSGYDTFRNRLVFPIRDDRGRVIGFGGRLISGEGPKYLNSPQTALYDKSRVLYGLYAGRQGIQQRKRVVVVEGYMDVLAVRQAGFPEAVATCGTALTAQHAEIMHRLCKDVIALFDTDAAGVRAAERALPLLLEAGLRPWRLRLPDAKDPDEFIQEHGADAFSEAIGRPIPLFEWLLDRRVASGGDHVGGASMVLDELIPLLKRLPANARAAVAQKLKVPEQMIVERLRAAPAVSDTPPPVPPPIAGWRPDRDVVHLLWLLVHRGDYVADLMRRAPPELLDLHAPVVPVVARLLTGEPVGGILRDIEDPGVARTLSAVAGREALYDAPTAALAMVEVINRLSQRRRLSAIERLMRESVTASTANDLDAFRAATHQRRHRLKLEDQLKQALLDKDVEAAILLLETCLADLPP